MTSNLQDPKQLSPDGAIQNPQQVFARLADVIATRRVGEEATEVIMAAKDGAPDRIVSEMADLWFHCLVALVQAGIRPEQVLAELARREGISGLDEKAARRAAEKP